MNVRWFHPYMRSWAAALLLSVFLVWTLMPLMTRATEVDDPLTVLAVTGGIVVEEETVEGYRHIYATVEDEQIFLTDGERNHTDPQAVREYAVWVETINGAGQIVLHHIPTATDLYLTENGTNQNPKVNAEGHVVWERWVNNRWQLFYFDGVSVRQLTDGDVSVAPDLHERKIVFTRQSDEGEWSAHLIDLDTLEMTELMRGFDAKEARWQFGVVVFPMKEEREMREAVEKEARESEARLLKLVEEERLRLEQEDDVIPIQTQDGIEAMETSTVPTSNVPLDLEPINETPDQTVEEEVPVVTTTVGTTTPETDELPLEDEVDEPPVVTEEDIIEELKDEPLIHDTPEDVPVEEPPVEDLPVEESPVEDLPVEESPVEEVSEPEEALQTHPAPPSEEVPLVSEEMPPSIANDPVIVPEVPGVEAPVSDTPPPPPSVVPEALAPPPAES